MCDEDCNSGTFGAGCLEKCSDKCNSDLCDPYTGSCYKSDNVLSTKAPTGVNVNDELLLSWRDEDPIGQHLYFVTLKVMKTCNSDQIGKTELHLVQPGNQMQLPKESLQNSEFEVCVTTSDLTRGHSSPTCTSHVTPKEPNVTFLATPSCRSYNSGYGLQCTATIQGDCLNIYAGNFTVEFRLSSYLACKRTQIHYSESVTLQPSQRAISQTFTNLIPGLQYNMTTSLIHNESVKATAPDTLTYTTSSNPPQVENLTVAIIGEDTVRFMWNDPCPPNGEIGEYYFSYGSTSEYVSKSDTKCPKTIKYDGCHNSRGWRKGYYYGGNYYYMFALNNGARGEDAFYHFSMEETRPSTPEIILEEENSAVIILPPKQPGGKLSRCNLIMGQESCEQMYREDEYMTCRLQDIQPGVIIKTQSWCCNEKFCGEKATKELATMPVPVFSGSISVKDTTNTSITITLPQIIKEGDGTSTCFILVEHVIQDGEKVHDLQAEAKMLIGRDKRNQRYKGDGPVWIAGNISRTTQQFEVGDGEEYGGFMNHPLEEGEEYFLGLLCATKLLDKKAEIWQELDSLVTVAWQSSPQSSMLLIIIIIVVLLMFIMVIGVYIYKNPDKMKHIRSQIMAVQGRETPSSCLTPSPIRESSSLHVLPTDGMSSHKNINNGPPPQDEALYVNIEEGECIYANTSRRILRSEVESYLNMTINSKKALHEFKTIPDYLRDATVGTKPSNKKKNRYRNNLPYDETRVRLSIINNDPSTDYINANHIQGYSNIRYIATQGPKDQSEPTIKDFWRMIVEQQVTAIIMVANFEEGGKVKVGQYMKHEEILTFDNYSIQVVSSLQKPYFTVSQIQVFVDGKPQLTVTHYHYTNWPDHGVPDEAYSISSLITFFLNNHVDGGGVVVHCSAGIGRTGTVLMVLLLHEMLVLEGSIDPIEVLTRLRSGRGRLVENIDQYNLALMITEEILFGNITTVTSVDLQNNLENLLARASSEYEKAKALPTPLSYRFSSSQAVRHLNRNPDILPSDNHRIYLQMTNGKEESQYINAVQIHGFSKQDKFLVTEHPLRETQARFWRMIMEKKCPFVVLINHYRENAEEFPPILPKDGKEMNVSGYKITLCSPVPSGPDLKQYTVTVKNPRGLCHTFSAYVVLNWEYGSPTPTCTNVLLNLADKLLHPTTQSDAGPPLLCCGDGATGCGLLMGITFTLQRAQTEQVFDIYRSVAKLLRYRYQFITCKEQYAMLYIAASNYLKDFSIYANFH
ncbi:receptor-type tyrosine-protein phosphatase delta-like [Macrobrachium nipponense]|uniref:receptor-type tyrosine-protein phosphatase delta-like n=1 Tax=Macrobrachium nipponense TaxID=159736 RepID=UPI0030C7E33E